ncbi:PIN domain-containing protein [Pedobacter alpinus]|uniref:PIN domain-containing protein n=1 Tax=Pedobacter alpinus TaxID=1590643 RepID=A0ABW5TN94_9SPHI
MNGNNIFVDTNILLYLLSGDETITEILHKKSIFISFVTELELLGFSKLTFDEESQIKELLNQLTIIDINNEIKKHTIKFRKSYILKLPDLIIASTAYFLNQPLFKADHQFTQISEANILIYQPKIND